MRADPVIRPRLTRAVRRPTIVGVVYRNRRLTKHGNTSAGAALRRSDLLARLDAWVAEHPFHARVLPFVVYAVLIQPVIWLRDWHLWTYPFAYTFQCGLAGWLMWRYRGHTPELNVRFHGSAVVVGVFVVWAWIKLGELTGSYVGEEPQTKHYFTAMSPELRWASLSLRLVGMSVVVPLLEEMFIRSWALRTFHSARSAWTGVLQIAQDLPLIGDWLMDTAAARRAAAEPPAWTATFERTAVGALSVFGVLFSTVLFSMSHVPRDWPACVMCGVAYCLLVGWTNRGGRALGLGPVVWAHGVTNALLLGYSVWSGDWRFV